MKDDNMHPDFERFALYVCANVGNPVDSAGCFFLEEPKESKSPHDRMNNFVRRSLWPSTMEPSDGW